MNKIDNIKEWTRINFIILLARLINKKNKMNMFRFKGRIK